MGSNCIIFSVFVLALLLGEIDGCTFIISPAPRSCSSMGRTTKNHWLPHYFHDNNVTPMMSSSANKENNSKNDDGDDDNMLLLMEEVRDMRVKELKMELSSLHISVVDVFEKEELVKRLVEARSSNNITPEKKKKAPPHKNAASGPTKKSSAATVLIRAPLTFFAMDGSRSIPATNTDHEDVPVFLRPAPGQFPALQLQLDDHDPSKILTMLLDTACSGIVVRPDVVRRLQLPTFDTPMTMTAAGGTNMGGGVAQLNSFSIGSNNNGFNNELIHGPFPVAVQDIGALPSGLDGIIGVSFLSRYETVEMDFANGLLRLSNNESSNTDSGESIVDATVDDDDHRPVAETDMTLSKLGIYTANVFLDGRGPVRMLVDTGAASTLLNWKGVSQMNLSQESNMIERNIDAVGAMGADNVALELTHYLTLRRRFNLQPPQTGMTFPGVRLTTTGDAPAASMHAKIDIGNLPVLDVLQSEGVGGILGSDLLMKCDLVRLQGLKGTKPKLILYQ